MTNLQSVRLRRLVDKVYHSMEYYREKIRAVGSKPGDIRGIEDLEKLPFTTKDDLRDTYPFGIFAVPSSQVTRIHASSNTTGRAMMVGYTRKDIDVWNECVARCITIAGLGSNDIIQVAYGYGLLTGGLGTHYDVEEMGVIVIPMSAGNTKKLITVTVDFGVTGIIYMPSYLFHITETVEEVGIRDKIKLGASINGAEPWTEKVRTQIERRLGIHARDIYGLSEIIGPDVAMGCQFREGPHIHEDRFLPEIVGQSTLKPLGDDMTDELVISILTKEGLPSIRYRTKGLTSLDHSTYQYGRATAGVARLTRRTDDVLIIRGVNVFPFQIESVLLEMGGITSYYLLIVDRVNNLDTLRVQVEVEEWFFSDEIRGLENLTGKITYIIQQTIGLTVKVKLVEPKSIERNMGKTKYVISKRNLS